MFAAAGTADRAPPARLSGREWRNSADTQARTSAQHLSPRADNRDGANVQDGGGGDTERAWDQSPRVHSPCARASVCVHGLQTAHVVLIERVWEAAAVNALMEAIVPHVTLVSRLLAAPGSRQRGKGQKSFSQHTPPKKPYLKKKKMKTPPPINV